MQNICEKQEKMCVGEEDSSPTTAAFCRTEKNISGEEGFSLIETIVALVIFMIAVLGIFVTFTYSVNYNAGNSARAQSLAIVQREVEQMRSAKFTPTRRDNILDGGVKQPRTVTNESDGNNYIIEVTVDDDPFTAGVQTDNSKSLKEITVKVSLDRPSPGWQTAIPAVVVLRRVRAN